MVSKATLFYLPAMEKVQGDARCKPPPSPPSQGGDPSQTGFGSTESYRFTNLCVRRTRFPLPLQRGEGAGTRPAPTRRSPSQSIRSSNPRTRDGVGAPLVGALAGAHRIPVAIGETTDICCNRRARYRGDESAECGGKTQAGGCPIQKSIVGRSNRRDHLAGDETYDKIGANRVIGIGGEDDRGPALDTCHAGKVGDDNVTRAIQDPLPRDRRPRRAAGRRPSDHGYLPRSRSR